MPAGLQVFNDKNLLQIDESFFNLAFQSKGTSSTSGDNPYGWNVGSFKYSYTGVQPVSAFSFNGSNIITAGVMNTSRSGNTFTVTVAVLGGATSINYWVFDRPVVASSGAGLEVYDSLGVLKYTSLQKQMSIVTGEFIAGRQYASWNYGTFRQRSETELDTELELYHSYAEYFNEYLINESTGPGAGPSVIDYPAMSAGSYVVDVTGL